MPLARDIFSSAASRHGQEDFAIPIPTLEDLTALAGVTPNGVLPCSANGHQKSLVPRGSPTLSGRTYLTEAPESGATASQQ